MLQPARRKYRKEQKGRNKGIATRGTAVSFGEFGLKATGRGRLTARQIEAARRAMIRHIKRGGRIWIRIFPDKPISQKPAEVRMGNGKGTAEQACDNDTIAGRLAPPTAPLPQGGVARDFTPRPFFLRTSTPDAHWHKYAICLFEEPARCQ